MPGAREHVVELHHRQAAANLLSAQPFGLHAQLMLERHILFETLDVCLVGKQEEIAAAANIDRLPGFCFERIQHRQTELR